MAKSTIPASMTVAAASRTMIPNLAVAAAMADWFGDREAAPGGLVCRLARRARRAPGATGFGEGAAARTRDLLKTLQQARVIKANSDTPSVRSRIDREGKFDFVGTNFGR